jgi:DNA-binding CsgD family transcriptional regulator
MCLEDVASIINAEQVRKIRRYTTMEGNEEFEVTFHDTFNEVSLFRLRRYPGWFFLEILLTGVSPLPKAGDEDGQTEQEMHQLQRAQALLNEIKAFEVPTEENKQKRDRIVTYFVPELERLQLEIKDPLTNKCLNIIRQNLEDVADSSGAMNKLYKVLTPSEIKVAEFIRMGMSSKDIANTLEIAQKTVDNHRNSLRDKLGLKNKGMNLRSYLMQIEEN